jgi:opacity protein-like surface antigen
MIMKTIAAAILLAACAARAGAAVVALKDGSRLRGRVVGQTADGVELATPDGTLHIGLDRVLRVDYDEPRAAPLLAWTPEGAAPEFQPPSRDLRQMVSLGFGLIEPVSRIDFRPIGGGSADNGDLGAGFGAQYVYFLAPRLGVGLDVDYLSRAGTLSERLFPRAAASVGGDTWLMLGILRCSLADRGSARPFILLGAGGGRTSETVDVRPSVWADTGTHETRRLIDDSAWTPAASVRLGLDIGAAAFEPGLLTVEAGWTGLASARYGATPQGQALGLGGVSGPLNILSLTARYGWRF